VNLSLSHDDDAVRGRCAPVLAVCGFSGSGKTTLLEAAIPRLVDRGLAVAVVKHDAHGFEVDRLGKDSDRLFRAGATVALSGPQQQFERRPAASMLSLEDILARLSCDHDLVLVEGHKDTQLPKLWLANAEQQDAPQSVAPQSVTNVVRTLAWDRVAGNGDRLAAFMDYIDAWLPVAWNARPLYRGLLVGGMSSRMGSPKQLIRFAGRTLGEIAAESLGAASHKSTTVALGLGVLGQAVLSQGELTQTVLPEALAALRQLPDSPGFAGPGAGLIAAHRWAPEAAWIVAACDHPWLRSEHIEWLAGQRQPGRWAVIPQQADGHPCPTLALYEPQALVAMERRSRVDTQHNAHPSTLLDMPQTLVLRPPPELADGWKNVNTQEELHAEELRAEAERLLPARKSLGH
jgi:molybdopterin-guanine dinucleotide biosynthesis protein MobB